jgi:aryl-alcohol dehydrogenase-like predicted oxidoreductase
MKYVEVPQSDLTISKAVFGTSRLGGTIERYDRKEALAILAQVKDAGINAFDTADIYAQGNSERLLAEAFRSCRDEVIIATKGGYVLSRKARILAKIKPLVRRLRKETSSPTVGATPKTVLGKAAGMVRGGQMARDFSTEHLARVLDASLKRLRTDRIDLYQIHSPTSDDLAQSDAFETLARFKDAGKIRGFGASVLSWDDLDKCFGRGVSWIQVEANLLSKESFDHWHEKAAAAGVMLIARQIFASGLLFMAPEDAPDAQQSGLQAIRDLGDPSEIVLRYLHHHAAFGSFLVATTRKGHLQAIIGALNKPGFESDDLSRLGHVLGHRA